MKPLMLSSSYYKMFTERFWNPTWFFCGVTVKTSIEKCFCALKLAIQPL